MRVPQWYENPHATAQERTVAATPEGARRLFATWPRQVHDALASHGMYAYVSEGRGGRAAVRVDKWRGDWPLQVVASLEFNPAVCDLGRLALLGELDDLLVGWSAGLDSQLEAAMERLPAEESTATAGARTSAQKDLR